MLNATFCVIFKHCGWEYVPLSSLVADLRLEAASTCLGPTFGKGKEGNLWSLLANASTTQFPPWLTLHTKILSLSCCTTIAKVFGTLPFERDRFCFKNDFWCLGIFKKLLYERCLNIEKKNAKKVDLASFWRTDAFQVMKVAILFSVCFLYNICVSP